ncbi:MAG TPA: hypothetical protein VMF13_18975, partial [Luteitalea sp.]|nr:hypothetical protein [Luteitalea sp.]
FAESVWAAEGHDEPLPAADNDLARLLDAPATPLSLGLRRLTEALPEQLPTSGVGGLDVKHFWGDITGTSLNAPAVLELFRERFADVMPVPVGVEPAAPRVRLDEGATLTLQLPGRGHVQVRVEAADDAHVVLSTLRGHPLAGVVRFRTAAISAGVRFEVMTADKAATPIDWLALTLGGARVQDANWRSVVTRVAAAAGGSVSVVHARRRRASEAEAEHLSTWVTRLTGERV